MLEHISSKIRFAEHVNAPEFSCFSPLSIKESSADQFRSENATLALTSACEEFQSSGIS